MATFAPPKPPTAKAPADPEPAAAQAPPETTAISGGITRDPQEVAQAAPIEEEAHSILKEPLGNNDMFIIKLVKSIWLTIRAVYLTPRDEDTRVSVERNELISLGKKASSQSGSGRPSAVAAKI